MTDRAKLTVKQAFNWLISMASDYDDGEIQINWDWGEFPQFDWIDRRELLEMFEDYPATIEIWGDDCKKQFEPDVTVTLSK